METSFTFLLFFSVCCLIMCLVKAWHYAVLLALIELAWVVLIGLYGSMSFIFFDLTLLYWALMLFLFSAVEVVLGFLSFLLFNKSERV